MIWPSDETLWLLLLGLLPVFYVLYAVFKRGISELASLRIMGIIFIWFGYQLSPWLAFLNDDLWDPFILVPRFIDDGILFSALFSIAFILSPRFRNPAQGGGALDFEFPKIPSYWIVSLTVVTGVLLLVAAGGIDELWRASHVRGAGQFGVRDIEGKFERIAEVLLTSLRFILAGLASVVILDKRRSFSDKSIAWLSLIVASLHGIYSFSRAAGAPFLVLAFIALRYRKKGWLPILSVSLLLAGALGTVGLTGRNETNPGIGNYLDIAVSIFFSSEERPIRNVMLGSGNMNPLDAMAPWTRKASTMKDGPRYDLGFAYLWNINPLPSEFVPVIPLGESLSEVLGTVGHTGITTPSLAETYYVFGWYGAVVGYLFGLFLSWIDCVSRKSKGLIGEIMILLGFISLPIGLHSSVRAFTRPLEYAAILYFSANLWRRIK